MYYYKLAQDCLSTGEFYPAAQHLYEDYLVAPLYINMLVVILSFSNSVIMIGLLNVFLNALQLFLVYKISKRIFNKLTAGIASLIYIFYLNTLGLVLFNYTEFLFITLLLSGSYFLLRKTGLSFLLGGFFISASIAIRPVGWAFLTAYLLVVLYESWKLRAFEVNQFNILLGLAVFIILFGGFNYSHFGRFVFTSTTGPINLLLGANDNATGGFKSEVLQEGNAGFIENPESLTYLQKGDYYYNQAISWIQSNPDSWLALAP
ncbi:MAG: hypothetical protein ACW98D_18290, partial [Promethearchaeota archaeon]